MSYAARLNFEYSSSNFPGGGQNLCRDGVNIRISGAVIDDAGTQAEFGVQRGVGEVHAPTSDDSLEDLEVQSIEFGFGQIAIAHVSETEGAEFDGRKQLQFRLGGNEGAEALRVAKIFFDGFPKRSESVIAEGKPQF